MRALHDVDCWIFDLDNTLYPASADLFALIDRRMGEYICDLLGCDAIEARRVQKGYFLDHGTTLAGLMQHHAVDPHHFLDYVHDIDMDRLAVDAALVRHIEALPGRKAIFTNGDEPYARRVLARLGLADSFELIHDIHATGYRPKPDPQGYAMLRDTHGIDLSRAAFFEDMARNLKPAKALGMRTIWINNGSESGHVGADSGFIDFEIDHLTPFLANFHGE
ncbi:pyrimidine 5'-nucleotidase [Sphingobium subterraneum]|uniref:Putative hydrolase of the HAD superfamily n=1 Tax=Sphingobium subterraneum TaxID=627688 RepID=A0A841J2A6_9SPHN|nr:pyrimidine 5'-nucleotidase [Sphingobium subterraneum]MBB6123666.1 putative hydrolase of the HAD superfamily [Sphingobium subterraneum]